MIRARIRAVTITVLLSTTTTFLLTYHYQVNHTSSSLPTSLHRLGLYPLSLRTTLQPLLLTALLFTGPLYKDIFIDHNLTHLSTIRTLLSSPQGFRNYLAGPITEELLFRATIIPLHLLSPTSTSHRTLILLTPLYFGIAHLHHLYEFRLTHPSAPPLHLLLRTLFQFGFTTVFGWYAAYIFLRTGSVCAVILVHAFCNYIGFPQLWGEVVGAAYDARTESESEERVRAGVRRQTVGYYVLLLGGLGVFVGYLEPLTRFPELALIEF